MDTFIVVDVVECHTQVGHHKCVWGENRGRSGRRSVNREKGVDCGELAANFFFLDVEETSNVFDHLLVGKGQFIIGGTVWMLQSTQIFAPLLKATTLTYYPTNHRH